MRIAHSADKLSQGTFCMSPISNMYLLSVRALVNSICANAWCSKSFISGRPYQDCLVITDLTQLQHDMQPCQRLVLIYVLKGSFSVEAEVVIAAGECRSAGLY